MFAFVTAALMSASAAAQGGPAEPLVAITPQISIRTCGGDVPISLSIGAPEQRLTGSFVGTHDGDELFDAQCIGHYETEPQFCVSVPPPGGYIVLEVIDAQGVDTTMGLFGESLDWAVCDDDSGTRGHGLLSKLEFWVSAGEYDLYIGSYSSGVSATFELAARLHDGSAW